MMENENFQKETGNLHRQTFHDVRGFGLHLAKSRSGVFSVGIVLILLLGAGGFMLYFIDDRIKIEMVKADKKILETVRAAVKDELPAEMAAGHEKIKSGEINPDTDRQTEAVDKLDSAIRKLKNQTARLEEGLAGVRKNLHARNEEVRKEAKQFVETTRIRVRDLEKTIETVSQDIKKLVESEDAFKRNARYEIQITYKRGSEELVDYLGGVLRDQGFRISTWTNIDQINTIYGVPMDSLESTISILPAPGESAVGQHITRILREDGGVPVVRTGVDKAPNSRPGLVGLLIPPDCSLPPELMKSSVKHNGFRNSSG